MLIFVLLAQRFLLRSGIQIDSDLKPKISKHEHAWYYISSKSPTTTPIDQIKSEYKKELKLMLPINNNLFSALLSHNFAEKLSKDKRNIWLRKIPSAHKFINESKEIIFIAICSMNCSVPGDVLSRSPFATIFQFNGSTATISKTSCIRSYSPFTEQTQFHTRFHRGMTFNNLNDFGFDMFDNEKSSLFFSSYSKLVQHEGYKGLYQTIAIVDTGVDTKSPFFTSPIPSKLYNISKIQTYVPFADEKDSADGHGTFIAGVAAGRNRCSPRAELYDGVASEAQLVIVDIHNKKTGKYKWPANFEDIFDVPNKLGATVHLNTWTTDDPTITTVVDYFGYTYSNMTIIFSCENGPNNHIMKPADSKNVLSVGETAGNPIIKYLDDPESPIVVYIAATGSYVYGYLDSNGTTLSKVSKDGFQELADVPVGDKPGQIGVISTDEDSPYELNESAAIIMLTTGPLSVRMNVPVIRMPPDRAGLFFHGSKISIFPSNHFSDSDKKRENLPHMTKKANSFLTDNVFQIKPDVVAPGGPMLGPKGGSADIHRCCNMSSLTLKEGASVAAALVAGSASVVQEYFRKALNATPGSSLTRAAIIHFSKDLVGEPQLPSSRRGWGTPQLDDILKPFFFAQDVKIRPEMKHTYEVDIVGNSTLKATLVWLDYPRDPASIVPLTQPLYLTISLDQNPDVHFFSNAGEEPSTDHFNTVHSLEIPVTAGSKAYINVFSRPFELFSSTKYSLVISGQYKKVQKIDTKKGKCPKNCEGGRGSVCKKYRCECPTSRGGEFCTVKVEKATVGDPVLAEKVEKNQWKFYKVFPDVWKNGSRLIILTEQMDLGKFKMFINIGKPPSWNEYLCTRTNCPWGNVKKRTLSLKYEEWDFVSKESQFYFGIVCVSDTPSDFEISFIHATE